MATIEKKKDADAPLVKPGTPEYVCRCRKEPASRYFMHIGVAWKIEIKDDETGELTDGYSVKLESLPLKFDGSFVIMLKRDKPKQA